MCCFQMVAVRSSNTKLIWKATSRRSATKRLELEAIQQLLEEQEDPINFTIGEVSGPNPLQKMETETEMETTDL